MFKIKVDNEILFKDNSPLEDLKILNPELSLGDNNAGSLTFTLPNTHRLYSKIECLKSSITVYRKGEVYWRGRPLTEKMDFWGSRAITCEGYLGFLNDTIQPQQEYVNVTARDFLSSIIDIHNSKVSADKQFKLGTVTVLDILPDELNNEDDEDDKHVYTDFQTTWECIQNKLVGQLEGHLRIRWDGINPPYLDYLDDYTDTLTQVIRFGKNLKDFVINYDETDYCTALIPLGAKYDITYEEGYEEYLDITDVNDGKNYITNDEAVETFGWIERVEHFDEIEDEQELLEKGIEFLSEVQFGDMVLEVSAVDLSYMDLDLEEFKLLYYVRVISKPHGLDKTFPITEMKIPLDNPQNTTYTLGKETVSSMSNYVARSTDATLDVIDKLPSQSSTLKKAKESATALINSATNGYVTIVRDGTGDDSHTAAIYISNTKDYLTSPKKWVWNMNGLGYTKDGGETYGTAITMNGEIVADYITTGTMSADRVRTGLLQSTNSNVSFDLDNGKLTIKAGSINIGNKFIVDESGNVTASNITVSGGSIDASKCTISNINATNITSGTLNASNVTISNLKVDAAVITSGTINSARIPNLDAGKITTGTLNANKVTISNLKVDAATVTSGTFETARIPDLDASKITTGIIKSKSGNTSWNLNTGALTMASGSININNSAFKVTTTGALTATDATLTGSITSGTSSGQKITVSGGSISFYYNGTKIGSIYASYTSYKMIMISSTDTIYLSSSNIIHFGDTYFSNISIGTSKEANLRVNDKGKVVKIASGSSKRFKHDIKDIEEERLDPHLLYEIPVVQFIYNDDFLNNDKHPMYRTPVIGMIAEDIDKYYPCACDYEEDGTVQDWSPKYIIPPMLKLIQEQNERITKLEKELKTNG